MLIVVCGLPGVGKTTAAEKIAARLGATHLRTDAIRWELFPQPQFTPIVMNNSRDPAALDGAIQRHFP